MRDTQYLEIFTDETMCLLQKNLIKMKLNDDIDETRFFFFFFGCASHHVGILVLPRGIKSTISALEARSHYTTGEVSDETRLAINLLLNLDGNTEILMGTWGKNHIFLYMFET